jgi:hypothetical protein
VVCAGEAAVGEKDATMQQCTILSPPSISSTAWSPGLMMESPLPPARPQADAHGMQPIMQRLSGAPAERVPCVPSYASVRAKAMPQPVWAAREHHGRTQIGAGLVGMDGSEDIEAWPRAGVWDAPVRGDEPRR